MKKTKILVTGAYGFIGRYICKYYSERKDAYVIGLGNGSWCEEDAHDWGLNEFHNEAISIASLVRCANKPDIIVHCAGGGSVGFSVQNPNLDFFRTVDATAQVLEYARLYCPNAIIIYPSSAAVYGCAEIVPIPETAILNPLSPYGVHKSMAEQLCSMYAKNFKLKLVVVRLFSVYGNELRKQLLWDACNKLVGSVTEFPGTGREMRDWLHVTDAAALLDAAGSIASSDCPILNGGCGKGVSVCEIINFLKNALGVKQPIVFTGESRLGDPKELVADIAVARKLKWKPLVSWSSGLKEYVKWYKHLI